MLKPLKKILFVLCVPFAKSVEIGTTQPYRLYTLVRIFSSSKPTVTIIFNKKIACTRHGSMLNHTDVIPVKRERERESERERKRDMLVNV